MLFQRESENLDLFNSVVLAGWEAAEAAAILDAEQN